MVDAWVDGGPPQAASVGVMVGVTPHGPETSGGAAGVQGRAREFKLAAGVEEMRFHP